MEQKLQKNSAAVEFAVNLHHYGGARVGWDPAPASIRVYNLPETLSLRLLISRMSLYARRFKLTQMENSAEMTRTLRNNGNKKSSLCLNYRCMCIVVIFTYVSFPTLMNFKATDILPFFIKFRYKEIHKYIL